jgi:eukaryotic-like serine/threonine-protein kinase
VLSLRPGKIIAGKYRLDHELARGGMGALWVAFDRRLRRKVAIKFINAGTARIVEASVRFEREARAVAQVRSPHVVQTYDYGMDRGHAYMVMELLEGEDLGVRLARERRLRVTTVAKVLRQIAKGLDAVHAAGIVHRDLKPANVFIALVAGEETVKLIDFGVARSDDREGPRATRQGAILGTVKYMAPEQALGETTVDHRSDLWSLAVIVYRLLTGKYPFQGATLVELVLAICQDPITPPSKYVANLPAGIDTFFERAFSRAPEERFHSAQQMASSFAAALAAVRTGTLPWGTMAPRASAPSAVPDPRNALESRLGFEEDDADRLCASRESLENTLMSPNALPPATGILPSSYTPSPSQRSTTGGFSRKRWWWASVPAALVVVGAVVVGIAAGTPPISAIGPRAASSASDASSSVPTATPAP